MKFATAVLALTLATGAGAQVNAGTQAPEASLPFTTTRVAQFNLPWRIAFFPDGKCSSREARRLWLVTQEGVKTKVANVPPVLLTNQGGMLGVYLSPKYNTDKSVYLTYAEPGDSARASRSRAPGSRSPTPPPVSRDCSLWRDGARGAADSLARPWHSRRQAIALSDGGRTTADDARAGSQLSARKILRLTLDGKRRRAIRKRGNRNADARHHHPPRNTEIAKTASTVKTYTFPDQTHPSETWTSGHRTPYGLAFAPDGRLWELEHGPRGGDELNLIRARQELRLAARLVRHNYDGVPIDSPDTRSDLAKPVIYWTPVIAPGNMTFYQGKGVPPVERVAPHRRLASRTLSRSCSTTKGRDTCRALERRVPGPRCGRGAGWRRVADREHGHRWAVSSHAQVTGKRRLERLETATWKRRDGNAEMERANGKSEWKRRVETTSGNGEWKRRVETASGNGGALI